MKQSPASERPGKVSVHVRDCGLSSDRTTDHDANSIRFFSPGGVSTPLFNLTLTSFTSSPGNSALTTNSDSVSRRCREHLPQALKQLFDSNRLWKSNVDWQLRPIAYERRNHNDLDLRIATI